MRAPKTFEMSLVVTSVRPMRRQPFDVEWDFIWHNAYHKVTLTQNSNVMKKYPADKNIFSSVTKKNVWIASCCHAATQKWTSGKIKYLLCGRGQSAKIRNSLTSENHTTNCGSITQKYFIDGGSKKNIPFSGCHLSGVAPPGCSVISHQNYPQSISCLCQRAATVWGAVIKHIPRHYFIHLRFCRRQILEPP